MQVLFEMRFCPEDADASFRTVDDKPPVVVSLDSLNQSHQDQFALESSECSAEQIGPGEQFVCGLIHFTEPYEMVVTMPLTSPIKAPKNERKLGVGYLIELLNGPLANIKKLYV